MTSASAPALHRFDTTVGPHVLMVDGSRIYAVDRGLDREMELLADARPDAVLDLLSRHGLSAEGFMTGDVPQEPPMRSLSLAVAQACNLGCTYCYAEQGSFGGKAASMGFDVARDALTGLIQAAAPGEHVKIAFLGGEPLANRALVREATEFAVALAGEYGVRPAFAITTNGTLVGPDDAAFFARHGFAVTVSMDGTEEAHDRQRPFRDGRGSYRRILANLAPLFEQGEALQVMARVTVTPRNLALRESLDHLIGLGFDSVGFSPVLKSPGGTDEMQTPDLEVLLQQMIACGEAFTTKTIAGENYPFSNMQTAMRELHRGTHRPYPCGAGAGYFGVSATGGLFACHRFVEDSAGALGNVRDGIDREAQRRWLDSRNVDRQEPCRQCWARYLCGGGCHHEVIHRGRPACDYIRGWLHYCLQAYVTLGEQAPGFFAAMR
jgi:uncharacterized protein